MAKALNFNEIATERLGDIERPPLPPAGTYVFQVTKLAEVITTKDEAWDMVTFPMKAVAPTDDVDPGELESFGKLDNVRIGHRFIFDKNDQVSFDKTKYQLRRFLEEHLKCADENTSLKEAMNNAVGQQCLGTVIWKADKEDKELFHANIGRTAPVE
jgi:hypothetical protein